MVGSGRVHDRAILDALEAAEEISLNQNVWRITRAGTDPVRGSAAAGRWSPGGSTEVLYTSIERDGALSEIGFRLTLEPVWPSRLNHEIHEISAKTERTLRFADTTALSAYGIDVTKYASFEYEASQALAAAAHFLDFDGLLVPSARHRSQNLIIFMDRGAASMLEVKSSEPVDWKHWRKANRK